MLQNAKIKMQKVKIITTKIFTNYAFILSPKVSGLRLSLREEGKERKWKIKFYQTELLLIPR